MTPDDRAGNHGDGAGESRRDFFRLVGTAALAAQFGASSAAARPPVEARDNQRWVTVTDFGAVGDGVTDNTTAIQAAIDEMASNGGGEVFFPPGEYRIDGYARMKSNVSLLGAGEISVIKPLGNPSAILYEGTVEDPIVNTAVRRLKIDGEYQANGSNALISMEGYVERAWIDEVHMYNSHYDGIYMLHDCSEIWVTNCRVVGCKDDGINPGGGWGDPRGTHNVFIIGNYVSDVVNDGIHISLDTDHIIVANNIVENCGVGVGIHKTSYYSIVNNWIKDCGRGITAWTWDGPYGVIEGNLIDGTTVGDGIRLSYANHHSRVANNICRNINGGNSFGIKISKTHHVSAIGNTIETAKLGISIWDAQHISIVANSMEDVTSGITLNGADCVISDNKISAKSNGHGIKVIPVNGYEVSNSLISGNYIQGDSSYGSGIILLSSGCTVSNNRIREASVYSIRDVVGNNKVLFNDVAAPSLYQDSTLHIELDNAGDVTLGGVLATGAGTIAERPSASEVSVGARWYDTSLSQPIWSDGSTWRDASGSVV